MELKKDIRKRVLGERKHISAEEWEEKSHRIYEKVVTHPFFLNADTIYCYVDYQREVETRRIIQKAWNLGKRVAVPKVDGMDMSFYEIQDFSELQSGYREILEPITDKVVDTKDGLVIVPGVAYDNKRNRIGYGKGFYDRFLRQHMNLKTIAIAFEMQMVEIVPFEPSDIRPEILITEEQSYV